MRQKGYVHASYELGSLIGIRLFSQISRPIYLLVILCHILFLLPLFLLFLHVRLSREHFVFEFGTG